MQKKQIFVGNGNIKDGQYGTFGSIQINLESLANGLGIDYNALKKLIAKDFDPETKQFKVPHLRAWTSKTGKSGTTLKLKIGASKQSDDYSTHWVALDDFIPQPKKANSQTAEFSDVQDIEEEEDDLPF